MNKQNHDQIISRKKEKTGWLRSAGASLLDLLYPGRCPVCERILLRNEPIDECMRIGSRVAAQVVSVFEPWVTEES